MGIGLVLVVSPYYAERIQRMLRESGLESWQIGSMVTANVE
jgi:phosphoribosylaminoimidazole (AIR) synthetase